LDDFVILVFALISSSIFFISCEVFVVLEALSTRLLPLAEFFMESLFSLFLFDNGGAGGLPLADGLFFLVSKLFSLVVVGVVSLT